MSFFSDQVLNKQGPLGKVWLASHLERKLSKSALLQANIPNSVTAILGTGDAEVPVMALRLSGQLLLGVARIYSRKAKYLQDDCSEALVKIKLAFRTVPNANGLAGGNGARARGARGDVDMVEDEAGRANINLNIGADGRGANDFDVLYNAEFGGFGIWDDFNMNPLAAPQANKKDKSNRNTVANQADITLREDHNLELDYDRTIDLNFGDEEGIGSQEYRARSAEAEGGAGFGDDFELGLDLDLELDLGLMDDDVPPVGADHEDADEERLRKDESPAAYAAKQSKARGEGTSRVASIAAQARELSEAPSEALSEVPSVEYGRDAATPLSIRNSDILGKAPEGLDDSVLKGHEEGDSFDMDLGGADFGAAGDGTTFDFGGDNYDTSLPHERQQTPRGTTPALSVQADGEGRQATPEQVENQDGDQTQTQIDMTPRTAVRVAEAAAVGSAQRKRKEAAEGAATRPKPAKVRKQIVDSVTELADRGRGLAGNSQSQNSIGGASLASKEERMAQGLLKEPKYLPATTVEMRFQEIYDHPGKFFFAGMTGFAGNGKTPGVHSFYAGPPGMPTELQALFQFRLGEKGQILGAKRAPDVNVEDHDEAEEEERRKRARSSIVPESEIGRDRQQSMTPGADGVNMFDFGAGAGDNFDDFGAGGDASHDFSLDLGNMSPGLDNSNAAAGMEKTPSRLGSAQPTSSPGMLDRSLQLDFDGIDRASTSILAVFDDTPLPKEKSISTPAGTGRTSKNGYLSVPGTRQSGISEEQSQLEESVHSASIAASRGKMGKWSRNTVKAIKILEHELGPAPSTEDQEDETEQAPKTISFNTLSEKASRTAAASMFFEMLILGTRDCIKLKQPEAYGDISVTSKDNLWQVCDELNKLSVEADEADDDRSDLGGSRQGTPHEGSSEAGETPTRRNQSRAGDRSTPVVSSSRSRRTADMSM